MNEYIKLIAALLRTVDKMSLGRMLLLWLIPILITIIWKLPEIIIALK